MKAKNPQYKLEWKDNKGLCCFCCKLHTLQWFEYWQPTSVTLQFNEYIAMHLAAALCSICSPCLIRVRAVLLQWFIVFLSEPNFLDPDPGAGAGGIMYSRVKRPDREIMLYILWALSVFLSVSPGSGNCINYGAIEDDKQKQTQKKVREGQIGFLMDCKIIFCHLRFSFLEVKWLLKVFSSTFRKKNFKNKYLCTHLFNIPKLCVF